MAEHKDRLKAALEMRKLRSSVVSYKTGIPEAAISHYLKGDYKPKHKRMKLLADALRVSEAWLSGFDVPMTEGTKESTPNATFVESSFIRMIPLYENASAGFGTLAVDCIIDYIPVYIKDDIEAQETIYVKVQGDSMYPTIEDGDLIQVHKQTSVDSGSIAVVLLDKEEALVKKVIYGEDWIELHSINPMYKVMRFDGPDVLKLEVVGLVKRVMKNL